MLLSFGCGTRNTQQCAGWMHPASPPARNPFMTSLAYSAQAPVTFVLAFRPSMQEPVTDPLAANAVRDERLASLLQAAAGGDGRAFESFYDGTVRYAMAVVRRIAGDALAEDVLSDCYFQAWRSANRFDAERG